MQNGFTRGLLIGSIIGAAFSMAMDSDMVSGKTRRKMMKARRNLMRRSGNLISGVVDLLR